MISCTATCLPSCLTQPNFFKFECGSAQCLKKVHVLLERLKKWGQITDSVQDENYFENLQKVNTNFKIT